MTEIDAPEEMSRISRCLWAYEELNINVDDTRVINRSIVLPQGSELAPLLFSFYIDEIWRRWKQIFEKCEFQGIENVQDFIYANYSGSGP